MSKMNKTKSKTKSSATKKAPAKKFQVPALSVPIKPLPLDPALERLKKKVVRRNAPTGEDIKKIKEIIKGINREVVTVQEFVGLVSPYTGDNGNVLRSVMAEDLANFRKLAKRVYDTMTQDVSDVLANEQIHITEYYTERTNVNTYRMTKAIEEIFRYAPNFDFELYYTDRTYLDKLFPIAKDPTDQMDAEELAMQKRQEAYHRLQWMRSEGVRLNEENTKLQQRLRQLKKQQKQALMNSYKIEENAEQRRNQLEATKTELQNRLDDLNESMGQCVVQTEEQHRLAHDAKLTAPSRKIPNVSSSKKQSKREPWNVKAAKSIESQAMQQATDGAASTVSTTSVLSKTGAVKKVNRPKIVKKRKKARDVSPFHFSPVKTPPDGGIRSGSSRNLSPFHYSPQRTPPPQKGIPPETSKNTSPFHYSPPQTPDLTLPTRTVRYENTTTVVEEVPSVESTSRTTGRRNLAPKDSWRGFQ